MKMMMIMKMKIEMMIAGMDIILSHNLVTMMIKINFIIIIHVIDLVLVIAAVEDVVEALTVS